MQRSKNFNIKLYRSFRTLGNPVRLRIYRAILEEACECDLDEKGKINENCVSFISRKLKLPQPTVSNHVKELINAGLIESEKRGKNIYLFGSRKFTGEIENFSKFITQEVNGH